MKDENNILLCETVLKSQIVYFVVRDVTTNSYIVLHTRHLIGSSNKA